MSEYMDLDVEPTDEECMIIVQGIVRAQPGLTQDEAELIFATYLKERHDCVVGYMMAQMVAVGELRVGSLHDGKVTYSTASAAPDDEAGDVS